MSHTSVAVKVTAAGTVAPQSKVRFAGAADKTGAFESVTFKVNSNLEVLPHLSFAIQRQLIK